MNYTDNASKEHAVLLCLVGVLVLATLPFALLKITRKQATGLDTATAILNSLCLFQVYQFSSGTDANHYGAGPFVTLLFLVPACGIVSTLWLMRPAPPRPASQEEEPGFSRSRD